MCNSLERARVPPEEGAEHCASVAPPYFARGSFTLTGHAHGCKHTEMSIKLIESGLAWHRERRIGNKIKVLINCGFRPLSSRKRDMKELRGEGVGHTHWKEHNKLGLMWGFLRTPGLPPTVTIAKNKRKNPAEHENKIHKQYIYSYMKKNSQINVFFALNLKFQHVFLYVYIDLSFLKQ